MTQMATHSRAARRQQWLEQLDSVLRAHGLQAAAQVALQALAEGVEDPSVLNLAASAYHREGRFQEAVELLERARALSPEDPHLLNSLGVCLRRLGRTDEALQAYDAAIRVDPRMAAAHFNRGAVLNDLNDVNRARSAYERAAALDPNYVNPLVALASLDVRADDPDSARARARRALTISPNNMRARISLASAELQQGRLKAAAEELSALRTDPRLTTINRSIVLGLTGDLYDAEGRAAEAFGAYTASNTELRALNKQQFEAPGTTSALEEAQRLITWFEAADPQQWREAPPVRPRVADPKTHAFLVGFPRSGTTLLENVLAAHREILTLEEKECLAAIAAPFFASDEGLERLARISPDEAERQRDAYWSKVRASGIEPSGRVFIDKMPLSSALLPVVAKLFPNAQVLFARRDPRDVVLSCFRRRFGMNAGMYQLLTLEGAAAFYDAIMQLSEVYRELLCLPWHFAGYESLVEDFEGTVRAACDFLGLEWDRAMLDFAVKARTRGISTPSAAQVARGLNREGQGAWHRYAEQLAPVLPLLEPWVQRFGYASV